MIHPLLLTPMSDQKSVQETDLTPNRTVHRPVLFQEVLDMLAPEAGGVYVDGTLGGGGHSLAIADRIGPAGLVISIDRDAAALDRVEARLAREPAANRGTVRMAQTNYADFPAVLEVLCMERDAPRAGDARARADRWRDIFSDSICPPCR